MLLFFHFNKDPCEQMNMTRAILDTDRKINAASFFVRTKVNRKFFFYIEFSYLVCCEQYVIYIYGNHDNSNSISN